MPVAPRAARWGLAAVAVVGSAAISLQSTGLHVMPVSERSPEPLAAVPGGPRSLEC